MNYSPAFQEMLERLLARYRLDPSDRQLRLEMGGGDQIVIEDERAEHRVRFSQYVTVSGRIPLKDLEILCFVGDDGHWIPYEMYRAAIGARVYGRVDDEGRKLTVTDVPNQEALKRYCDILAFRLRDQGWLQHAITRDASGMVIGGPFLWPKPTVEEPSEDDLEAWMIDDVCEASDGCLVEPDGVCPHGHPSWLLRLGLA